MRFSKNSFSSYDRGIEKEWILTNGRSGFAGTTIIGANSRKYHGVLIAAIKSPDERYMVLPKVEEALVLNNKAYPLTSTKYIGETSEGFKNLQSFTHEGIPTYKYLVHGVDIQKRVFLQYGKNTAIIEYKIKGNGQEGILKLTPFVSFRSPRECSSLDNLTFEKTTNEKSFKLIPKTRKDIEINLFATSGQTTEEKEEITDYVFYDEDISSGDKCIEQYYIPGSIEIEFNENKEKSIYFIATIEKEIPVNIEEIIILEEKRIEKLKNTFNDNRPIAKYLPLGADNFIVDRDSINSKTILAGYPWFLDWGRDTMIAVTGITMSTNRLDDAKEILKSFSLYEKNGLIPNMFPDFGQEPLYNTVDASLWYVKAIYDYLLYSDCEESVTFIKDEIYPTIKKIIDSYKKGTDFSIGMKDDYLIWAGDGLDQVTWMDVRVNDIVVTPRHGKPVEINALWYNALKITSLLANKFGDSEANEYEELATKVKNSFENKFWNEKDKCLYDVVSDNECDSSIRPNQIWAISLPFSILDREKERAVVNTVYKKLYTPYGLRSLSCDHEEYKPMYIGKLFDRDMAYHQGTVWGFPLGAFLTAYCKVNDYSKESVEFVDNCLKDMESHIQDQCLCGIAEIFDGEAPHHGRGCYTQAWSVGEIIRVYYEDVLGNIEKLNKVHSKLFVDTLNNMEDRDMDKIIRYCKIDTFNEMTFKLKKIINHSIVIKANNEIIQAEKYSVSLNYDTRIGKIVFGEEFDITNEYKICICEEEKVATMGNLFSTKEFKVKNHYDGNLGAIYRKEATQFVIWAPTANNVNLLIYNKDNVETFNMKKGKKGEWSLGLQGDLKNTFYNYSVKMYDNENVVVDPYAKAVGVNGETSMVIDLEATNPKNWSMEKKPELLLPTDAVIYELHIRDFSIAENSGVEENQKGKYLGLVQKGTTLPGTDIKTTLDHLKELGITHLHLLPIFDYKSVNEADVNTKQFNWGYDPQNYNALEGSYSTNALDGNVRIEEFKKVVSKLHEAGIRVVMDVVYNHTFDTDTNCLNLAVPFYYHRVDENGEFSDGAACGNETASERSMVRRYIIDSVKYWAEEYHIDGFRFDLMALHDLETMKEIRRELDKIDPSIIVYGEGWNAQESSLPKEEAAFKINTIKYDDMQIACFSDDMRDAIKGDVFEAEVQGFVNGGKNQEETIKAGVVATIDHNEIDYKNVLYSDKHWANEPYQTINYDSAHDNYTLWDKLQLSCGDVSEEELIKMNMLCAAIVLTSQGIPFLHAGEEFLRSKVREDGTFEENSYKSPDSVNKIDWNRKKEYIEVFNYYTGLIELRKVYNEFRLGSAKDIKEKLTFLQKGKDFNEDSVVAFKIKGDEELLVIYNANNKEVEVKIEVGSFGVLVNDIKAGVDIINEIRGELITVPAISAYVIKKISNE